jgi:hypothetical protein
MNLLYAVSQQFVPYIFQILWSKTNLHSSDWYCGDFLFCFGWD